MWSWHSLHIQKHKNGKFNKFKHSEHAWMKNLNRQMVYIQQLI